MAWTAPMVHAVLLRTAVPVPKPPAPLRVMSANRPARSPSPRGAAAAMQTGYKRG